MKLPGRKPKEAPIDWEKVKRDAKKFEEEGEKFARENGLTGRKPGS